MSRIEQTFACLKAENRKALVSFTMAGDPDAGASLKLLERLAESADILEIGMPFSDPMADGPAVQAAGIRALDGGMTIGGVFALVQQFRSKNELSPLILMGYFNPILRFGVDKFCNRCKELGVDGLIIVDIPPEEGEEIALKAQQKGIDFIRLVTPTTDEVRLQTILKDASGFLYYVSITGVTGTATADPAKVGRHLAQIREATSLPVVAGFGIRTPADAKAMGERADGVVVGSALVQTIAENLKSPDLVDMIGRQVDDLANALKS